ncbi:fungal-specific transcription factor domain-containing protein [Chaetomium sp. MPI-CAGE-AT-0009]|nr:fungal-specific transcription factor domain-containing protein [Chaetomium sp. MPI-CAGE-AT-0009]
MSGKSTTQQHQHLSGRDSPGGRGQGEASEPTPLSCNPCRKRKLRCSRELPACQHCRKIAADCVYETKRNKPGLKPGALENVHRRLDALEQVVQRLDHEALSGSKNPPSDLSLNTRAYGVLALLAQELPKLLDNNTGTANSRAGFVSNKRRRTDESESSSATGTNNGSEGDVVASPSLPLPSALDMILETYFVCIHPWIPMIHQTRFRTRLADARERPKLEVVLHAMVLAASRFVSDRDAAVPSPDQLRSRVVLAAMDCMSVESLQAMIIVSFNDIGSGLASRAWPLVGSMTRTVEYLQLTIERNKTNRQPLSQPFSSLTPAKEWTEEEERRRVFWNVFALDRFCSIAMGWNTSLTSDDVHRRLPCDGILWRRQEAVTTPFFGIWNKAAARIGNPIAFLPSEPSAAITAASTNTSGGGPGNQPVNSTVESPLSPQGMPNTDMSTVGAYAYCIEATESLSRITSHFLQQPIDWREGRDISLWLTRFKELDLRLVHWKMLLPQKWKAESYLRSAGMFLMDPNLTLAHITHNASMILLHQPIAFPAANLEPFRARLPSACSVETCLAAATEVATITTKYLGNTPSMLPVAHQYAFCVYIAARVLLVHWRYGYLEAELPDEFWVLVRALDGFSTRWRGYGGPSSTARDPNAVQLDLAARYAQKLRSLHASCIQNRAFKVNVAAYTTEIEQPTPSMTDYDATSPFDDPQQSQTAQSQRATLDWGMYRSPPKVPSPLSMGERMAAFSPETSTTVSSRAMPPRGGGEEMLSLGMEHNLGSISQTLLDQQFGEMDRIIGFEDGTMFAAITDGSGGW